MCGMSNNNIRLHELVGSLKLLCVEPEWIHESLNMSEHAVIKIPSHPPVLFFLLPTVKMQEVQQQVHEGDTKSRGHRCWCWPRGTMCILESERRCVHQTSQVFDHHPIATKNPKSQKRKPHVPHALQIIADHCTTNPVAFGSNGRDGLPRIAWPPSAPASRAWASCSNLSFCSEMAPCFCGVKKKSHGFTMFR